MMLLYLDNENLVEIDQLTNQATGAYVNDATVTVTVQDAAGNAISGETFPKTLTYVPGSDGKYQAALSDALVLTPGRHYTAFITAFSGALDASWQIPLRAAIRDA